ncbi:hypothetical protein ASD22_03420 [Rhodanobacter sp. Root480]|uniref:hypothetical protein n=1 Tax=Rhodanobacter sp. Root480 TaxID=1736542 RepID=UPI0006FA626F|nr:hypothetical protein [Rhodanobacter sp. Root480]KQX99326.1 hypothetical protein ASD22_03420 [Rhodanobacter sp. Root480]
MNFPVDEGDWVMSGSKEPGLLAYGVSEPDVIMCAVDGIHYAMDKAEGNRDRFVVELVGEFEMALRERMGVDLPPEE